MAFTTDDWVGTASADWGASASNWSKGLPGADSNVVIDTKAALTVFYSDSDSFTVNSLTVGNDAFDITGGSLTIAAAASFANGLAVSGGTLILDPAATLSLSKTNTLSFAFLGGSGTVTTAKDSTTDVDLFALGGGDVWQNFGTVAETGTLVIGDGLFNVATFINEKGAVYDFTGDVGIAVGAAPNSTFVNDLGATIEKTGGSSTTGSVVSVDMTDDGSIVVKSGVLEFTGYDNSFAGRISGAGQLAIGAGTNTITGGATIATADFNIGGANTLVRLGENLSYAGTFVLDGGALLDLGGFTLTLSGDDTLSNPSLIDGKGTLVTAKGSTVSANLFTFGGAADWKNFGTVSALSNLTIGDASFDVATFTNETGGVFDLAAGSVDILIGAAAANSFINAAGALFENAVAGTDSVAVPFVNDGSVRVAAGEIEFENTVTGAGSFTIKPGTVLEFESTVAKGSTVDFASTAGGELLLQDSRGFAAAIKGFGGGDTDKIDLRDINFTSAAFKMSYSAEKGGGVLTVADATHAARLDFLGTYTLADFHASNDGTGGTLIVDPTTHASLFALAR